MGRARLTTNEVIPMANIQVQKDNGSKQQTSQTGEIAKSEPYRFADPFRMMRDMFRWDPFREMEPIFPANVMPSFSPDVEVKETNDAYLFKADVPGVKENEINVTLTGNRLTITGERNEEKEEKTETYYSAERKYGSFSRAYTLPEGVDAEHIHADLKNGVLTVAVPKKPEMQPKKIAVKSASSKA
jgi:HSP20 family protein